MNRRPLLLTLTQVGVIAAAIYMAVLITPPWYSLLGLTILSVAAIAAQIAPAKCGSLWTLAWLGTLLAWAGVLVNLDRVALDDYHALLAGQIALAFFIVANRPDAGAAKSSWNLLGIIWGFLSAGILLVVSYLENVPGEFCLGLFITLFLLILCRVLFQLRPVGIQIVNTFILLVVVLPIADAFIRFRSRHDMNLDPAKYYSYEAATKNPSAYGLWMRYYEEQWNQMAHEIMMPDPNGFLTFRLRPDSHAYLFHSWISVNHKGFRGPEIPDQKGNTYRIVALGESTTFGCTLNREDRPWPEVLEQMIRERIHPTRPVEVINAGIPAATLPGNLGRLTNEILSLKPDMLISYHGFNGFYMLEHAMPPIIAKPAPKYLARPSKLLADFEYALKLTRYKRELMQKPASDKPAPIRPMNSDYAVAYRKLIQITATNGIRLVLANYSMAVNSNSTPELLAFYRQTAPALANDIRANMEHSEIVETLARQHPEICFVDTHPALDGKHQNFIDLVHFTQSGRQLMAETFFAGIKKALEADLSGSQPQTISSSAATPH